MRPLGSAQLAVLEDIKHRGGWSTCRCGWVWGNWSQTIKICESLVRRGLVTRRTEPGHGTVYEAIPG